MPFSNFNTGVLPSEHSELLDRVMNANLEVVSLVSVSVSHVKRQPLPNFMYI